MPKPAAVPRRTGGIEFEGRVVNLNRWGARIQVPWALNSGQTVRIQNPLSRSMGKFRVVKTVVPATAEKDGEFGVECLEEAVPTSYTAN